MFSFVSLCPVVCVSFLSLFVCLLFGAYCSVVCVSLLCLLAWGVLLGGLSFACLFACLGRAVLRLVF